VNISIEYKNMLNGQLKSTAPLLSRGENIMSILMTIAVPHPPLIIPQVGRGEEKKIRKTVDSYMAAMKTAADLRPDTVIVTSPHSVMYSDYFHISPGNNAYGDFGQFRASEVKIKVNYDNEFREALTDECRKDNIKAGTLGERNSELDHGTMIPLYFLNKFLNDYKVIRIGLSGLSPVEHYSLGKAISSVSDRLGRRTILIASGDLSHKLKEDGPYGYAPEGPEFDRMTTEAFSSGDFLSILETDEGFAEKAAECGLRSYWIMTGALDRKKVNSRLLSYEGPFGVGYSVAVFTVCGEDETRNFGDELIEYENKKRDIQRNSEDQYVKLARLTVETYVKNGKKPEMPKDLPEELTERKAGVFVTLKKNGQLRGCIGTISPVRDSVADEIMHNAVSSAASDPRFEPVRDDELGSLVYSVDVLGIPENIESEDELDVKKYGVIVERGGRRGLLLPDLDGVDTPEEQVAIAKRKAGIAGSERVKLQRFEVIRHH
jgi:AmmeMemoRadiSam system protein A/AmmeMemoRadiSam system protein B